MVHDDQIYVIVDACLELEKLIQDSGTDEMKVLIRALLFKIGQQIAQEQADEQLRSIRH